jgi:hypothetical protein
VATTAGRGQMKWKPGKSRTEQAMSNVESVEAAEKADGIDGKKGKQQVDRSTCADDARVERRLLIAVRKRHDHIVLLRAIVHTRPAGVSHRRAHEREDRNMALTTAYMASMPAKK